MNKAYFFLFWMLLIGINSSFSQTRNITGKVLSAENKEPIIGATVQLKGFELGTITDINGNFSIQATPGATRLIISYVGMKTKEVDATSSQTILLESTASELDEVMVVAYGTSTKKSFTGSASAIKGSDLSKLQSSSVSKSLEGSVAGVQIASSSGQPGEDAAIRIRGLGSISASQAPLIVVDGSPYEGSLNSISSQDIESLNVLKDAAANSMYGSRGSNGVILITTKKGKSGKTKINFESRFGINNRGVSPYDVITDAGDYYEMAWEAERNNLVENGGKSIYDANFYVSQNLIDKYLGYNAFVGIPNNLLINSATGQLNPLATEQKWTDNWLKEPFTSGTRQEYTLNMSGGNETTQAYLSMGYLNDKGYVVNSDFTRINTRIKIDQQIGERFNLSANFAYTKTNTNAPISSGGSSNYSNVFMFSQMIAPIYPIYAYDLATGVPILSNGEQAYDFGSGLTENGLPSTKTRPWGAQQNPLFTQLKDISRNADDNLSGRVSGELNLMKDLKFSVNVAYDVFNNSGTSYATPLAGDAVNVGIGSKAMSHSAALNTNQLLNYTKSFDGQQMIVLLGHESKKDDAAVLMGDKKNYYDPYNPEFTNAGAITALTSYTSEYRTEGYFSRIEYNRNDKMYFSASLRRDGSSKFAPDVRWGNFWSVGGAWRISEEESFKNIEAINSLKLKMSYGTQGNDGIGGSNLFLDQYEMITDGTYAYPSFTYRGVPELTWEKSNNFNLGFEMKVLDRMQINADFFVKETKDMIYRKPLPPSAGVPNWKWSNEIDMRNQGLELEMTIDIIKTKNLQWNVALNATTYANELTRLPLDKDPTGYEEGAYWRKLGGSLYDWYLIDWAGVDPITGKTLWYMDDGNGGKTTTSDYAQASYYEIGKSSIPDFTGGVSSSLVVGRIDVNIQTAFQVGGYVYDNVYNSLMSAGVTGQNWHKDMYARWTSNHTQTEVARLSTGDQNANAMSSHYLISASYFSLRNVSVGYTLPQSMLIKYKIESARIYLVGDNLLLLSARQGLDPRQSFSGDTGTGTYSALRTTSIGLTVSF